MMLATVALYDASHRRVMVAAYDETYSVAPIAGIPAL